MAPKFPSSLASHSSKMAGSSKSMESLFEQQDREKLLQINIYSSGGIRFKGSESSALSLLNKLRLEGEGGFCDVILEVEGRQLTTHRCVLAANSQFFYTMFSSGMIESSQKLLKLQSVSFDSMSLILDYFYTREIVINDDNVFELLNTSSFLLVTPVKKACIQLLFKQLSKKNCFSILQVAEQFGASDLANWASNSIKANFFSVMNNEEFVSISKKSLINFISSDEIQVEREEEVYQAVLKWVRNDEENRVSALPELLSHLRGKSLPKGFLKSEMTQEPLLASRTSLLEPSKSKTKTRKTKGKRERRTGSVDKPAGLRTRPSTELHNVVIGVSGLQYGSHKAFCYDLDKRETFLLPEFPDMHFAPKVAVIGRTLYIVTGYKFGDVGPSRVSALCLDEVKNQKSLLNSGVHLQWKTKTPCQDKRRGASLAVLNGLLYYIGGWYESVTDICCNTVECYNPEIDDWSYCASLNVSRCFSGCVTGNGHIYIIGGGTDGLDLFNSGSVLSSVERYDPENDSWSYVASMKQARIYPSSVYLNGKIYVIGGGIPSATGETSTTSCEVYSPNTDEWHSIASLPSPDSGCNNVVIKNQIVVPLSPEVIFDLSHNAVKYNVRSNTWQKMKHFGPSNKLTSFTLCTTKLPSMILQKMPRPNFVDEIFDECSESEGIYQVFTCFNHNSLRRKYRLNICH